MIDRDLPIAVRSIATGLRMGLSFEQCLKMLETGYGEFSVEITAVLKEAEVSSIPEALRAMARRHNSRNVKRVVGHLILAYESGSDTDSLKNLSRDLLSLQKQELKKYSSQMVLLSLVFIATSAIFPALFQAYVIVGSGFMDTISAEMALAIPTIAIPAVNAAVIFILHKRKPAMA